MKRQHILLISSLTTVVAIPITLAYLFSTTLPDWRWEHHPIHALIEGGGAMMALIIAAVIMLLLKYHRISTEYIWVAMAMIAMGVLDGFHASQHAGNIFVWFHSVATMAGGLLFMLVALPKKFTPNKKMVWVTLAIVVIVSIAFMWQSDTLPPMASTNEFTMPAVTINFIGGAGFVIAWAYYVISYSKKNNIAYALLAHHCLLFGTANFIFELSVLWDATWWLWHFLRLTAYSILLFYFFDVYRSDNEEIIQNQESLIKSRESLAKAQRIAHMGNWEWDLETNACSWSDEFYRILGLNPQSKPSNCQTYLEYVHPDDVELVDSELTALYEGHKDSYDHEHLVVRQDGAIRTIHAKATITRNTSKGTPCLLGTIHDITEMKVIENELKNSESRLRAFLESSGEAIYCIDLAGNCTYANNACVEILGYKTTQQLYGRNIHNLIHHSRIDGTPFSEKECKIHKAFIAGESSHEDGEVFWRPDGSYFPVEYRSQPLMIDGEIAGAVVSFSDISARKAAQARLQLTDRVFRSTREAIMITKADGTVEDVNQAFSEITGYDREEIIGKNPRIMKSSRHDDTFYRDMWREIIETGGWHGEIWDRRKDGNEYPKLLAIDSVTDETGKISHYIGIFTDITQSKLAEEKLQKMAFYDSLTGLPNRSLCNERLNLEIRSAKRRNERMAILYIDLDQFKYVNDTLGHTAGDMLLKEAAKRISGCIRESDTVARLGGDEFMVILTNIADISSVEHVTKKIINVMAERFYIQRMDVSIGASIGISIYPDNGNESYELQKNSDAAMYKAKESGRNTFRFYTEQMQQDMVTRLALENDLRYAMENGGLLLHYQPKVSIATGQIYGMGALLRWQHPEQGLIEPEQFIPLAEETGMITQIGQWVLYEACRQTRQWMQAGYGALRVSVNLSVKQFEHPEFIEQVEKILDETGLPPELLELEITESTMMQEPTKVLRVLRHLREKGIYLSIDDFGTGYSSLSYLKRFPIQCLKIAQSFIRDLDVDKGEDEGAIISAIISMAKTLSLDIVAEGVEKQSQLAFLKAKGCDYIQGFYYSQALPPSVFIEYINVRPIAHKAM